MKLCPKCGTEKPTTEFNKDKSRLDGFYTYCKSCTAAVRKEKQYYKAWKAANQDKVKRDRITSKLRKYGLTHEDFERMLNDQDHKCGICKSTDPNDRWGTWHIDHCHKTGTVRGLLCSQCNTGLGKFYDEPERLERAARYLRATDEGRLQSLSQIDLDGA